ncbi:ATPase [Micromonospora sp. NPDC049559]|uniref:ATPase n=1 Tax=Micromonospora sp. NPDC049559 TaxID=3155923 RepID=UPI00341C829B
MEFSVVHIGYDQDQVDCCLDELDERLTRMAARAESAAGLDPEIDAVRAGVDRLRGLLGGSRPEPGPGPVPAPAGLTVARAETEAAEILARAREELTAAREEARLVRDRVYAEAVQARRDFEAALYARRQREQRVDEILREVTIVPEPVEPTPAPTGVPATRVAASGAAERATER